MQTNLSRFVELVLQRGEVWRLKTNGRGLCQIPSTRTPGAWTAPFWTQREHTAHAIEEVGPNFDSIVPEALPVEIFVQRFLFGMYQDDVVAGISTSEAVCELELPALAVVAAFGERDPSTSEFLEGLPADLRAEITDARKQVAKSWAGFPARAPVGATTATQREAREDMLSGYEELIPELSSALHDVGDDSCDHTLSRTRAWAEREGIDVDLLVRILLRGNLNCDCQLRAFLADASEAR